MARFVLRPFRTSTTYTNLKARGEGVFHVTDDVLLLAQTAIGAALDAGPRHAAGRRRRRPDPDRCLPLLRVPRRRARRPRGADARSSSRRSPRDDIATSSASTGPSTPWSRRPSWRRARRGFPCDEILVEFRKLEVLVDKTGGPRERAAFTLLHRHRPRGRRATRSRPGPESIAAHDQPTPAHPDPEPLALRPAGLGAQAQSTVRRRRPDDRVARDRAHGRAGAVVDRRGPAGDRASNSSSTSFEHDCAKPA